MSEEAKEAARAAAGGGSRGAKAKQLPPRIQAYVPEAENERIRNAYDAVGRAHGYASLGDLFWRSALEKVEQWEKEQNGGKPFEPSPFPVARRGRPPRQR